MPRDVGRHVPEEPGDVGDLLVGVVEARDEQRDDLDPEPFALEHDDRVEDVLQGAAESAVVPVTERLQIDLVQPHVRPDVIEDLLGAVAIADVGADEIGLRRLLEHGDRPLRGDERLVVGRGEDRRPGPPGQRNKVRGGRSIGPRYRVRVADRLRGDPVLTVPTVEVAPQHPEGQCSGSGQRMEERLLLDRVDLQRPDVSPRDLEPAPFVETNPADSGAPLRDEAAMTAGVAAHRPFGQPLVNLPLARQFRECPRQRRRRVCHRVIIISPAVTTRLFLC